VPDETLVGPRPDDGWPLVIRLDSGWGSYWGHSGVFGEAVVCQDSTESSSDFRRVNGGKQDEQVSD